MEKFIESIKKIWGFIAAAIGVVTTIAAFVQLWQGQRDIVLWAVGSTGLLILISLLVFLGFSKKQFSVSLVGSKSRLVDRYPQYKSIARSILVGILLLSVLGIALINGKNSQLDDKVVILLTKYDGPESNVYRVNEIISIQLEEAIKDYDDTVILTSNEIIPEQTGSSVARKLGTRYRADLVIWGWYSVTTTNVLVTTHVENISREPVVDIPETDIFALKGTVAEINDFTLQQNLSNQMAALSLYVSGMARYELMDYQGAIDRFRKIESLVLPSEHIGNYQDIYINIGNAYFKDSNLQKSEEYFLKAIEFSKTSSSGEDARTYLGLAQVYYTSALLPFDKSKDMNDIDVTLLQKAQDTLDLALQAKYQPENSYIQENVYFSRGQVIFMYCLSDAQTCDLADARNSFERVIGSYEAGNDQIKNLAAESHARIGLIYVLTGNPSSAAKEYQKAGDLSDDSERKKLYLERANDYRN